MIKESALKVLENLKKAIEDDRCTNVSITNYPVGKNGELNYGNSDYTFKILPKKG